MACSSQKWERVDYNVWLSMRIGDDGITYFQYSNSYWPREHALVDYSINRLYKCKYMKILQDNHSTYDYKEYRYVEGRLDDGWKFLSCCDDDGKEKEWDILNNIPKSERDKMQVCSIIICPSANIYYYLGDDESPMGALALSSISYYMHKANHKQI